MYTDTIESENTNGATQMNMQEQSKIIRREGVILERFDKEKEDGVTTGFFVEWQGSEYYIRMHNGQTKRIRKLAE